VLSMARDMPSCDHVLRPVLPSVAAEAADMYASYMADPSTPAQVRRAPKSAVMRLLMQRATDHYQTIGTNAFASWKFDASRIPEPSEGLRARLRFANQFDMRRDVRGEFRMAGLAGAVSNVTQTATVVALLPGADASAEKGELSFWNRGSSAVMTRPRRDVALLVPADSFEWNLVRAFAEMVSVLALVVAFGVFLSAGLGRPVAVFVAMAVLLLGEMSPSVVEQYPDELDAKMSDRIGLWLTRAAADFTSPVSSLSPLESLAANECVEASETLRVAAVDFVLVPLLFALLSGLIIPRKQET